MDVLREASVLHLRHIYGLSREEIATMYDGLSQGYTAFHKAILYKHTFKLVELCEKGAHPLQYNHFKESGLMLFANINRFCARDYEIIGILVRATRRCRASILIQRWLRMRAQVYVLAIHMTFKGVHADKIKVPPDIARNIMDYLWSPTVRKRKYVPVVPLLISQQMREPSVYPLTKTYFVRNNPFKTHVRSRWAAAAPALEQARWAAPAWEPRVHTRFFWRMHMLVSATKHGKFYFPSGGKKDRQICRKGAWASTPKRKVKRRKDNYQKRSLRR